MSHTHTSKPKPKDPDKKDPEKMVDLPPYGARNADPLTDSPGSHPIETGIGATVGGALSGLAIGAAGGPLGAVAGAIVGGAAAGGLAGKGIGELIDPTTEDNWIRDYYQGSQTPPSEEELAAQRGGFRFGLAAQARFPDRPFRDVEADLRHGWEDSGEALAWSLVKQSIRAGFEHRAYTAPI